MRDYPAYMSFRDVGGGLVRCIRHFDPTTGEPTEHDKKSLPGIAWGRRTVLSNTEIRDHLKGLGAGFFDESIPGALPAMGWIPGSVGLVCLDLDNGDLDEFLGSMPEPHAVAMSSRPGRWHIIYATDSYWQQSQWSVGGASGDVRHLDGYIIDYEHGDLWRKALNSDKPPLNLTGLPEGFAIVTLSDVRGKVALNYQSGPDGYMKALVECPKGERHYTLLAGVRDAITWGWDPECLRQPFLDSGKTDREFDNVVRWCDKTIEPFKEGPTWLTR